MPKIIIFPVILLFLSTSVASAQKRAIGYSQPGPLGEIIPDAQPPVIHLTATTGLMTLGEGTINLYTQTR